jgi:hypothetical protein
MQILEIVLYSYAGKKRVLSLKPGKVNIITGSSATGKSALIDIVDYCLGRTECMIPEGIIREKVSWFGLLLQVKGGRIFVARENPAKGYATTNQAFLDQGDNIGSLDLAPKVANTTIQAVEDLLSSKIGIGPNLNIPPTGQTRTPLAATIRHALYYCFQQQSEIASKSILFHRQSESFIPQSIKDTMPYFLGAIQEDRLALEQKLAYQRRELKKVEQALKEAELIKGEGLDKASSLISEACEVGILPVIDIPAPLEERIAILKKVSKWTPKDISANDSENLLLLSKIQDEIYELEKKYVDKVNALKAAKTFAQEIKGFGSEIQQQELRLDSIGLFNTDSHNADTCPICLQNMKAPLPKASAIMNSLKQIKVNLETFTRERPKLRDYIQSLEKEKGELGEALKQKRTMVENIIEQKQAVLNIRNQNVRCGRVLGRISLWLESIKITDANSELKQKQSRLNSIVADLEKQLDLKEKEERMTSILNRIGVQMTQWANDLQLEHSGNPVRFDLANLTIVVDRKDRPIPLEKMGSGENWVGYHLITYLSLHEHFCEDKRPVPRFLFLDQPTQVYYPSDRDSELRGSIDHLKDEDRIAVSRMFKLIFDIAESLFPELQIIVTDHADLTEKRFESAVVGRWRDKEALIPADW